MRKGMYCIYDKVTNEYSAPTVHKNDAAASRAFLQGVLRIPSHKDLSLWCVGSFDDENVDRPVVTEVPYEVPVDFNRGEKIE